MKIPLSTWLRAAGPLLGLVATWVLFAAMAGGKFTSWSNQELMLLQTAVVGTAAVGATWIIVSGGIDLSVGANIALSSMVGALVLRDGHGFALAALATVLSGAVIGWLIGALVVGALARVVACVVVAVLVGWAAAVVGQFGRDGLGVGAVAIAAATPIWVLTANVQLLARGVVCVVVAVLAGWTAAALGPFDGGAMGVGATSIAAAVPFWLLTARIQVLTRRSLPLSPFIVTLGLWGALRGLAKGLGDNQPIYFEGDDTLTALMLPEGLLPPGVWVLLLVAVAASFALRRSVFGRHVVAMGSSRDTARLCGVDLPKTELRVYVLGCACAGVAAVLQLSYLSMGDPTTGQGYELKAIAAAVIGGASLTGGEGAIFGTLLGALIMTVVDNGCTKLGLDNWVQEVVTGAIIVAAVALDRWRQARG